MPDRRWQGWAALLAEGLGPPGQVEFHNLAELGAQPTGLIGQHRAKLGRYCP
jgi:hypothetical protein